MQGLQEISKGDATLSGTDPNSTSSRTDGELLRAISEERDRAAFAELLDRYNEPVTSLCHHMTGNRDDAQDLAQEIMLRLWTRAETYREDINPRAWILRMASRQCLKFFRRERAARRKKEEEANAMRRSSVQESRSAPQAVEKRELLAALRDSLRTLPDTDRVALALHYGAELPQNEVGKELSLSQQAVSKKIQNALDRLRGHLKTTGFAAALPLVGQQGLNEALCTGLSVPDGVRERLVAEAARTLPSKSAAKIGATGTGGVGTTGVVFVGALVLAFGGMAWWGTASRPADTTTAPNPVRETPEAETSFRYHWTFEKEVDPGALRVANGEFERCRYKGTGPWGIQPDFKRHAHILVLHRIPQRPFIVTLKALPHPERDLELINMGANYIDRDVIQGFSFDTSKTNEPMKWKGPFLLRLVFLDRYCFLWFRGQKQRLLREYAKPYPGDRVYLSLRLAFLTEAEIRSLSHDEIEKYTTELEDLKKRIELSQESSGNRVSLPEDLLSTPR